MIKQVLNVIRYSVGRKRATFGHGFDSAYHSISICGEKTNGQREVSERIDNIPYDFKDKVVLDFGCNIGGMLHELKGIKKGIGFYYSSKCINAANLISSANESDNLSFYVLDLDNENIQIVNDFVLDNNVDICFVLAIALWVKKWKEVVLYCSKVAPSLVYEANGDDSFQQDQFVYLKTLYSNVTLLAEKSKDDNRGDTKSNQNRRLYLCQEIK